MLQSASRRLIASARFHHWGPQSSEATDTSVLPAICAYVGNCRARRTATEVSTRANKNEVGILILAAERVHRAPYQRPERLRPRPLARRPGFPPLLLFAPGFGLASRPYSRS